MAESTGGTVKAEDIQLNYDYKLQIIVPNTEDVGGTPQTIARGFDNITEAINEVLYQTSFLSDKGWGSSYVTGGQLIFTLTGVRVLGDAAQDYIFSDKVYMGFGAARDVQLLLQIPKSTAVQPTTLTCNATLAKITRSGGAANQPCAISVEIHINGKPEITAGG